MGRPAYRIRGDIRKIFLTTLVVFGLVPARASQQDAPAHLETSAKPYEDPDAYAIYSILLRSYKDSSFVIRAETESRTGVTPESTGIKGDRSFRHEWGDAVKNYSKGYSDPSLLTRNFSIEAPYELVPKEKMDAVFEPGTGLGWEAFYKNYPLSRGYYWFSAVGFDSRKTHAIVQMNNMCGGLCGRGELHFFEKKDGMWREVQVDAERITWFS
jgi:hypothetical protein